MSLWISLHLSIRMDCVWDYYYSVWNFYVFFLLYIYLEFLLLRWTEDLINPYTYKFLELIMNETKLPLKMGSLYRNTSAIKTPVCINNSELGSWQNVLMTELSENVTLCIKFDNHELHTHYYNLSYWSRRPTGQIKLQNQSS